MLNGFRDRLESPIKRYLIYWHGEATDPLRQKQYYRCELCRRIVTWHNIASGGCRCGVGSRIRAAHLTMWEKCRLLVVPWTV
jgi:hypothetical protein